MEKSLEELIQTSGKENSQETPIGPSEKSPVQLLVYKSITFGAWFIAGYFATVYSLLYNHPIALAFSSLLMFCGLFFFASHLMMDFLLTINFSLKQTLYEYHMDVGEQVNQKVAVMQLQGQLEQQRAFIQHMMEHGGEMSDDEHE